MRTLLAPAPLVPGPVVLADDEARHALTVLRLEVGERVRLADGAGRAGIGTISAADRRTLTVELDAVEPVPEDPAALLTLAVAAPKGDRLGDLVRMLTELGVGRIAPLVCARGERVPGNPERLGRIAAEALKQCRRGRLPVIAPPATVAQLAAAGGPLVVLDPAGGPAIPGEPAPVTLVIGPEGGLTTDELATLAAAGAARVRVAGPILRIETAAVAAAAVWAAAWRL
jgi:16S rRNA (uracil1498-N3)-methyltransferase